MKLLLLGGTLFLGRHLAAAALARGHEVTLFNRGRTNPDLFPEAEKLLGDRDGDLAALRGRRWDAAVDTGGYVPRVVQASAEVLAGNVDHLTFVSTVSVYADLSGRALDEGAAVRELELATEDVPRHYGALKAACERTVAEAFPDRLLCVRPGLLVGPHDPTGRFTYWLRRVAAGGEVLAPAEPSRNVQLLDARDLAGWLLTMIEARRTGVFNAAGPAAELAMGELLVEIRDVTASDARFTWASEAFLLDQDVGPWTELPLWTHRQGFHAVDSAKARAAGLAFRPLGDTIRDTFAWDASRPRPLPPERDRSGALVGLDPGRERELLAKLRDSAEDPAGGVPEELA